MRPDHYYSVAVHTTHGLDGTDGPLATHGLDGPLATDGLDGSLATDGLDGSGAEGLERALGRRVRAVRIGQRTTQAALAGAAGVSPGALRHLEHGTGANVTTLVRVLAALGRSSWLDTLEPPAFNPLDLLAGAGRATAPAPPGGRVTARASRDARAGRAVSARRSR